MSDDQPLDGPASPAYPARSLVLPALGLVGFTQIVQSGGALYDAVRRDGRWEELRGLAGPEGALYGVASHDAACPEGWYRYTVAVEAAACRAHCAEGHTDLHSIHVPASEWVAFALSDFGAQYGEFWQANPYRLIQALGWEFNAAVGMHLDVYGPAYQSDHDSMEFLMPVRRPG